MASKVKEIIFFTHPRSDRCHVTHQLLKQYVIPHVPFTVKKSNASALKRKGRAGLTVRGVPTLLVTFKDGNLRRFEGDDCNDWIQYLIRETQKAAHEQELEQRNEPVGMPVHHDEPEIVDSDLEYYSDFSDLDDDELLDDDDEPKSHQIPSSVENTGKINIQALTQKAEEERNKIDSSAPGKRRRREAKR